jgi:hypothetical protein
MSSRQAATSNRIPVSSVVKPEDFTPNPDGPELPPGVGIPSGPLPGGIPLPGGGIAWPGGGLPPFHLCQLSLPEGCYQLNITSTPAIRPPRWFGSKFRLGSLRVEKNGTNYAVSGDTYRYSWFDVLLGGGIPSFGPTTIPIYPRNRYNSYLKITAVNIPFISTGACKIHLTAEEYDYTQPAAGSFDGTFPASPSRVLDIYLTPIVTPVGFSGPYFSGQVYIGGVLQSNLSVTLAWVSAMFRRATVELHTMAGSVAPAPVPSGGGTEYLNTIYAKAKWDLTVLTDPNPVPVPTTSPPTVPTTCWSNSALHAVMTALSDFSAVNLDTSWQMHVLIVQAQLGCGRGVMFDTINVPREGVASFCEDGYPTSDSAWFGSAANQEQKNVPRAFLRSCTHEITHGFNQIHQEQEGGADNSIMTTTPSVANSIHAAGDTFPNDINLDFNSHVRHHLRHLPDPIVRPGGMTFTAGHNGIPVPSEDEVGQSDEMVRHPSLELSLKAAKQRVKIGEPLRLSWTLTNSGSDTIDAPNYVGIEHHFAELSVLKPDGSTLDVAPFVIVCDASQLSALKPGQTRTAAHDLFWSTQGFSFNTPGMHRVELKVSWNAGDVRVGASDSLEVLVDYPVTERDNDVIAQMLNPEVGKFIALGGHAYHLKEAVARVSKVARDYATHDVGKCIGAYYHEEPITSIQE